MKNNYTKNDFLIQLNDYEKNIINANYGKFKSLMNDYNSLEKHVEQMTINELKMFRYVVRNYLNSVNNSYSNVNNKIINIVDEHINCKEILNVKTDLQITKK